MQKIFDDMFHKNVECYVDDLVVKSRKREDHLLQMVIEMKITSLEICGDSKLVINQLLALYELKSNDLVP